MFAAQTAKGQRQSYDEELVKLWSESDQAGIRGILGDDEYERLYREGGGLTLDQTIQLCLGRAVPNPSSRLT